MKKYKIAGMEFEAPDEIEIPEEIVRKLERIRPSNWKRVKKIEKWKEWLIKNVAEEVNKEDLAGVLGICDTTLKKLRNQYRGGENV